MFQYTVELCISITLINSQILFNLNVVIGGASFSSIGINVGPITIAKL